MENLAYHGRVCADCKEYKPASEFSVRKTGTLYSYCKPCTCARTKANTDRNPDRRKAYNKKWYWENRDIALETAKKGRYLREYGITYDAALEMLEKQNFLCEICDKEITEKTMVVDHCHDQKRVRSILCNLCNISLAPIEREGFLEKALAYIERHRSAG